MKSDKVASRPMFSCPRFANCAVPIFPLDQDQDKRTYLKGEPRCRLGKAMRIKIGNGSNLPYQGMTKLEWAAHGRWRALSEDERAFRTSHLRPGTINHTGEMCQNKSVNQIP